MPTNIGIGVGTREIKINLTSNGTSKTHVVSPSAARLIAEQLNASADIIDKYDDVNEESIQEKP